MYNLSHLPKHDVIYSLQNDEALLLYSLVKLLNPKIIVEFGFLKGFSAINFLSAMSFDSRLISFDPDLVCKKYERQINDKRLKLYLRNGETIKKRDISGQIDLALFDASHTFQSNIDIFKKIKNYLSDTSVIAVHDTGLFNEDLKTIKWTTFNGYLLGNGYAHQPEERMFVNYIKQIYPEFQQIHLHTMRTGRMGMTLLQRYKKLEAGNTQIIVLLKHFLNIFLIPIQHVHVFFKKLDIIIFKNI